MPTHDDDIDFAMTDLPTRPGPTRATTAPEQDSIEKRLAREVGAAEHIAAAAEAKALSRGALACNALSLRNQVRQVEIAKRVAAARDVCCPECGHEHGYPGLCDTCGMRTAIEVKHGSGRVKV